MMDLQANERWVKFPQELKLLLRCESFGCKDGTGILYLHAKFSSDLSLHGGGRWRSSVFCLSVTLELRSTQPHIPPKSLNRVPGRKVTAAGWQVILYDPL